MPKIKTLTKAEFITAVAEACEGQMSKGDIAVVLDALAAVCIRELRDTGAVAVPGLVKFKAVKKGATAERTGVSPFTKQPIVIRAKPATTKVKVSVAKTLKEALAS